jgi:hypothetical protein
MREISREPRTHEFLLKALREAGGELVNELEAVHRGEAAYREPGEWSAADIALHVRDSEQLNLEYIERILSRRSPELRVVDIAVNAEAGSAGHRELDRAVYQYATLREQLIYQLWGLPPQQWQRTGVHVYRGPLSVLQIARELHLHDLEHLWQVRALRERPSKRGGPMKHGL